jgi:Family of unknown function (DUF6069)
MVGSQTDPWYQRPGAWLLTAVGSGQSRPARHLFALGGERSLFAQLPPSVQRFLSFWRVDFAPEHRQPSGVRVALATVASVLASLVADAVLVAISTALFRSTKGYVHFRFSDYGKLTVIGVVVACLGWPIVTRISSSPKWLYLRLAVLVTLVLWLPDLYILAKGQPPKGVAVLMVMHLAIAAITYTCMTRLAKVDEGAPAVTPVVSA